MSLRTIADVVTSGGVPKDGLTVTLWQASRFVTPPEKGDDPADVVAGAADYSVVSSGDFGGVGTWRVKDIADVAYFGHALIEGVHCWAEYPKDLESSAALMKVAAVTLSAHRAVCPRSDGTVEYATNADLTHAVRPIWLTLTAALAGDDVEVMPLGEVVEPSWSWSDGPVYLGANGALTQALPASPARFLLQLAGPTTQPDALFFAPRTPIALA